LRQHGIDPAPLFAPGHAPSFSASTRVKTLQPQLVVHQQQLVEPTLMATHSCHQCGKVFTGSEYLTKHITRRHPQILGKENVVQLGPAAQAKADEDIDNTVDEGARRLAELVAKAKADEVITSYHVFLFNVCSMSHQHSLLFTTGERLKDEVAAITVSVRR
jgi:predicted  nucleic acid-binding Zn-ribbon protein